MIKESIIENITLPKDWKMLPFGDVCEISGGSQPPKPTFIYEPKEGYIRLVQVRDYRTNNFITYIPKEKAKKFCNKTDIMIGRYGPPIFGIFRGLEGAYNVALMKAIPNKELLNQEYLYWFLKTDSLVKFVEKSSKRAAGQDGVRKEVLYTYPTPLPPLPQQKQIVAILDKAFAAIDTAKANAAQNLLNAKELFESYLQNIFENKGDDWEEKKLSEIADVIDSLHRTPKYSIEGYPMVRVTDIKPGFLNLSKTKKVDKNTFDDFSKKHTPKIGDIVLSRVGSYGVSAIVNTTEPFCLGQNTVFLIPKINSNYFYHFLNSPYAKKQIDNMVSGSTQPTISLKSIRTIFVPLPNIKTQEILVKKIETISNATSKLEAIYTQKIADLEEMKKSVLQKAFSGQLNTLN
jgi:type I restriction enzyme S subunit